MKHLLSTHPRPSVFSPGFHPQVILLTLLAGLSSNATAQTNPNPRYAKAGWQATLSTRAHGVRGTVTIIDTDTFRVDNFFYDGGGIKVHFILAPQEVNSIFASNRVVTERNFLGSAFSGGSVTVDLPAGTTFAGQNAISLWCIPAGANFGSGTFRSPLEIWRQSHFTTYTNAGDAADDSDPDKDGLSNIMEYATRTNPRIPDGPPLELSSPLAQDVGQPGFRLKWNYRPEATDLHYILQRSSSLSGWTEIYRNDPAVGNITRAAGVSSEENAATQTISITDIPVGDKAFWRLTVQPVP